MTIDYPNNTIFYSDSGSRLGNEILNIYFCINYSSILY